MPHPVDMVVDTGDKGDLWMDAIEAEKRVTERTLFESAESL